MKFFKLPNEWVNSKNISKETIYKILDADEKIKRIFIEYIEKIRLEYIVTETNSNISKVLKNEMKYEEIDFIKIYLRKQGKEGVISKIFHKIIPKPIVLILEYQDEKMLSTSKKRISGNKIIIENEYKSNWIKNEKTLEELNFSKLDITNLERFYESISNRIRGLNLDKQLEIDLNKLDDLEKIEKEIEELKRVRKKETQINRIAEIQGKILLKIKERDKIKRIKL